MCRAYTRLMRPMSSFQVAKLALSLLQFSKGIGAPHDHLLMASGESRVERI